MKENGIVPGVVEATTREKAPIMGAFLLRGKPNGLDCSTGGSMRGPDKEERELLEQYGFEAAVCRYCSRGWESTKTGRCKGCGAKIPKPYGDFWGFPVWFKDVKKASALIMYSCYGVNR